jgi:two-component system OmpR family response regulator
MMMAPAATAVQTLLVEDDPDAAEAISGALRKSGFEVDWCQSAGAALVELELSPRPAAAIIDLRLPDANGAIVMWRIRRDYGRRVPVAVVTGVPNPLNLPHLVREPPDVVFSKPLDIPALIAWLRSVTAASER